MKRRHRIAPLGGVIKHNGVGDFESYLFESSTALRKLRLVTVVLSFGFEGARDFTVIAPGPALPEPIVRWAEVQLPLGEHERETVRELPIGQQLGALVRGLELEPGQILAFEIELSFVRPPDSAVLGFKVEVLS